MINETNTVEAIPGNTKKCYIKTYGCQMNVYDSERMAEALVVAGYQQVDQPDHADMVILNTCHIREKAVQKVYSDIGRIKPLKQKNAEMIIAVAGCVAQAEGAEIMVRAPVVDMVFGPQTFQQLPEMLDEVQALRAKGKKSRLVRTEFPAAEKFAALKTMTRTPITRSPSAYVTVQEGCDKFCTFCVVPYTRGEEVSRNARDIVAETQALVDQGVCEVTLLGQNVNAWQDRETGVRLDGLLSELGNIVGVERLRFTTSHPRDMDEALIAAHGNNPKLMPYLHLPVQAGSDKILEAMNRKHSAADYLELVAKFRAARPDLALSSDFIVGFPGETDDDFDATIALVEAVNYAQAYSFKYSPRPGTPAAEQEDQVEESVKNLRLQRLQALLNVQKRAFNEAQLGRVLPVLFDKPSKKPGQMSGRSPYLQTVHVTMDDALMPSVRGRILPVLMTAAHNNSLSGHLADGD
ncbi:tRNA (N6-isopentenyl adenosine(37)-C2)-methylthiotransferase MiaB [Alphaproteobacteria bacterium]|nr:tRNA (N6-isopentenyl adenosine(37)-C2)-methylthiotransferase MiaB [Alphaproteobacteria bacterium]